MKILQSYRLQMGNVDLIITPFPDLISLFILSASLFLSCPRFDYNYFRFKFPSRQHRRILFIA